MAACNQSKRTSICEIISCKNIVTSVIYNPVVLDKCFFNDLNLKDIQVRGKLQNQQDYWCIWFLDSTPFKEELSVLLWSFKGKV